MNPTLKIFLAAGLAMLLAGVAAQPAVGQTWENLLSQGDSALAKVQYAEAQSLLEQALHAAEAENGKDDGSVVKVLLTLGRCYYIRGMYAETDTTWTRALDISEKKYGTNLPQIAKCLNNLAILYKNTGRCAEAEPLYRRAIDLREKALGEDHPDVAATLNNLGNLLLSEARFAEAEPLYGRALEIMEKSRGEDHPDVAAASNNLAALYEVEGRYHDAEPLYRRALDIYKKAYGPTHPDVAQCLNNLAHMYDDEGEYAKAEPLYREALDVAEATQGKTHPKVAATLSNLARLYSHMERYSEAEPLAKQSVEIGEQSIGANSSEVAEFRKDYADILQLEGRLDEADSQYTQALGEIETAVGKDHPIGAAILHGMAMLALARQNVAKAVDLEQRAYLIRRKLFNDGFAVLAEQKALEYSQFLQTEASNYVSVLLASPASEDANQGEIAKVVFSTKGLVTDGIFARHKSVSLIAALADSLSASRAALSELYVRGEDPARPWAYQEEISRATDRKEKFEADLARSSTEFRSEKIITQVDARHVAGALPSGTGLVEYMRYERADSLNHQEPRYLAVVVKSNGFVHAYDLGTVAEIDSAVAAYRRHMVDVRDLSMDEYDRVSGDLFRLVWLPFEMQITGLSAVFVSPDDALCLVSFAGLKTSDGEYLIERLPVQYISSGRDLVREEKVLTKGSGLLAIGDPNYDASIAERSGQVAQSTLGSIVGSVVAQINRGGTSQCRALRDLQVSRLPATRSEVTDVVNQWQSFSSEPATELFDAQATEDAFKSHSHGMRVIHLATHGYYISNECKPENAAAGFVGENPLLLSGLFFAGANLKGNGAADAKLEDGTLTAEEVAGLNLSGTDLVVLSACETGLGEIRASEGVFGLRRAFQMAGARTVISALWPVDDKSTAELMGDLFAAREPNIYDGMRQAALKAIASRRAAGKPDHPFFWAGFIATGAWTSTGR